MAFNHPKTLKFFWPPLTWATVDHEVEYNLVIKAQPDAVGLGEHSVQQLP